MQTPSPFPYFGSKATIAPWIIDQFTPHKAYVEPFAGSCAVLFSKQPSHTEVINDLDGEIVNFFRVLRDQTQELIDALRFTPYSREEYRSIVNGYKSGEEPVERARQFCVRASMSFNGVATGQRGFSTSDSSHPAKALTFARRVERMADMAERLRNVEIENIDAIKLIDRWDKPSVTLYCDPPYSYGERVSAKGYECDTTDQLHQDLVDRLLEFHGQVVLSGYANELYDSRLVGPQWRRLEREVQLNSSNASGTKRVEVLWVKDRDQ